MLKLTIFAGLGSMVLALMGCGTSSDGSTSASATGKSSATSSTTQSGGSATDAAALAVGADAPKIEMTLQDGKKVTLGGPSERMTLVYFYPKDETKGCTIQAEGIRDAWAQFQSAGIDVYGVSTQDAASHQSFIEKHSLPFPLAVDTDGTIAKAFKVPVQNGFAKRQSFLIGKDGKVKAVWLDVKPDEHADSVLKAAST